MLMLSLRRATRRVGLVNAGLRLTRPPAAARARVGIPISAGSHRELSSNSSSAAAAAPLTVVPSLVQRTHDCGSLRASDTGRTVTVAGWLQASRNFGPFVFITLRDAHGTTQLVSGTRRSARHRCSLPPGTACSPSQSRHDTNRRTPDCTHNDDPCTMTDCCLHAPHQVPKPDDKN
jgi:hypothetical protein